MGDTGVTSLPARQPPLWVYEERLVPHRRGGGSGGVGGKRLRCTQAGARLLIGGGIDARCDVTDARCSQLTSV